MSYRPPKTGSSCLSGKRSGGHAAYPLPVPSQGCSLGLCLCLCPGSLASVTCTPWAPRDLCSSYGKPGKGWGMGRETAEYFFPFSPAAPAQGPHLWPQPSWGQCGWSPALCSLVPAGAGWWVVVDINAFLGLPASGWLPFISSFHGP